MIENRTGEGEQPTLYGDALPHLEAAAKALVGRMTGTEGAADRPYEHIAWRIKSEESMREKCRRKGLPETRESALTQIRDAIGIRVVCRFTDDIWAMRERIRALDGLEVVEEKDYIHAAKPNGYRSYHIILRLAYATAPSGEELCCYAEIQLRTIAMDTWAALEHEMRYKRDIPPAQQAMIGAELKRVAAELASCDVSMQTIRDLIREG